MAGSGGKEESRQEVLFPQGSLFGRTEFGSEDELFLWRTHWY